MGWGPFFARQLDEHGREGLEPARVTADFRDRCLVRGAHGEVEARLAGGLLEDTVRPVTGDWVLTKGAFADGLVVVKRVLARNSVVARGRVEAKREASQPAWTQVLAANVDTVFIVEPLVPEPSLNRVERYLALALEGGAMPAVVLAKADLEPGFQETARRLRRRLGAAEVLPVSAVTGQGMEGLDPYLAPGQTVVFLGPSGAGKSTLINRLLGRQAQAALPVRAGDGKGRHTTTARRMFELPGGGLLIDTPGLRAVGLGLAGAGLELAFQDIEQLAQGCRFRDCRHGLEPGCAVRRAQEAGELEQGRLENYLRLRGEAEGEQRRRDPAASKREGRRMAAMVAEARRLDKRRFES